MDNLTEDEVKSLLKADAEETELELKKIELEGEMGKRIEALMQEMGNEDKTRYLQLKTEIRELQKQLDNLKI